MPLTFENILLSCLHIGFSLDDFKKLKVGTILDIITTKANNNYDSELKAEKEREKRKNKRDNVRMATSSDDIMSFF